MVCRIFELVNSYQLQTNLNKNKKLSFQLNSLVFPDFKPFYRTELDQILRRQVSDRFYESTSTACPRAPSSINRDKHFWRH